MGQHAPRSASADNPAQGIEDLAQGIVALRGLLVHQNQVGRDKRPFIIGDIGGVRGAWCSFHRSSIPTPF
jgi:hypothetical protein